MITARQLKQLMTANPFRPFRVHLSDGSHYDVPNHDAALVEHTTLDVAVNPDRDGIAETLVRCAIIHIVKLEDIEAGIAR